MKMRKGWLVLLLAVLTLLAVGAACAETYVFDDIRGTMEIPDTYVVLTPSNLTTYDEWLQSRGSSAEKLASDMSARGVLVQAWSSEYDMCFELTAVQNDQSKSLWDVNEQSTAVRGDYRLSHYPDNAYLAQGIDFSSADWKNTPNGRFLVLRYVARESGQVDHRGLMRRTIRNGYEITFDMQIYGRNVTNKDNTELNKIWESFSFVEILPLPPAASAKINVTGAPPTETNSASFNFEGTASQGVKLTAVVMGLNYPDPILSEVEVGKNGKFKLPIKLPKEGVFLITVTADYQGETVAELAYPVTYQRTLLTVNFTTEVPEVITSDLLSILGTGEPGATIQVFINGESAFSKKVTAAGKFKVEIDTKSEGSYEVVLAFSKKTLADRRFTFKFTRDWSQTDMLRKLSSESISPAYATLVKKIDGYDGRTLEYKAYVADISQSGSDWIVKMAMGQKKGEYTNIFLVTCSDEPALTVGERVIVYGTCAGMSLPSEDSEVSESYPCLELLQFASIN
ncbi:MAG: hypothetical protein PHY12_05205 [Eubacteriales bacterium]|nr:hypothetical protein [Eubacteriales bacterium]